MDGKARDVTATRGFHVPVARDLGGVCFRRHWIKDWLFWQSRRKTAKTAFADKLKLLRPHRTIKDVAFFGVHGWSF